MFVVDKDGWTRQVCGGVGARHVNGHAELHRATWWGLGTDWTTLACVFYVENGLKTVEQVRLRERHNEQEG